MSPPEKDTTNYVGLWVEYDPEVVVVIERDADGALIKKKYNPPYYFFVEDPEGDYTAITGEKLIRAEFENKWHFNSAVDYFRNPNNFPELKRAPRLFEVDFAPKQRVLMDNYYGRPSPLVHYAFIDIEVDYKRSVGFAGPSNPYAPINAVTVYQSWTKKFITLAVPPKGWTGTIDTIEKVREALIAEGKLRSTTRPEIILCEDEHDLLKKFVKLIEDADIISGWNSEFFDIPYIYERLDQFGGKMMVAKLDYQGAPFPKKESVVRFGSEETIIKLMGRTHLDYMQLFKKFTFEGRVSYALGNILDEEVGVGKIEYDGTLEELYNNNFELFVCYNFRDVDGLDQLDDKFKFIALANQMAHENTVPFSAVLGTVSYVETGIANHAHYVLNKRVINKKTEEHDKVEGAVVLNPDIGLHEWIGSVDINSLYPNTIRSLNISPEKIVGHFTEKEEAWSAIRSNDANKKMLLIYENKTQDYKTASEWKEILKQNKWAISAHGVVFDQSGDRGVVADILGFWYAERKRLQAEKKRWGKLAKELPAGPEKEAAKKQEEQYDLLQLTKKISMNSLYGALLNVAFRFGDERMGASVTATGRQITTHMIQMIGEFLSDKKHVLDKRYSNHLMEAGNGNEYTDTLHFKTFEEWNSLAKSGVGAVYKPLMLVDGKWVFSDVIIYGDTDSCYYRCAGAKNKEEAIEIADLAASVVNDSFPQFMREAFNCQPGFDDLIKAGREIVGVRGLFQAKKKYMIKVVDLEGTSVDKLKSMGSEIKKSDTPKIIQAFLKKTVDMILDGQSYDDVAKFINEQRKEILKKKMNVFSLGVAKQVNNVDKYTAEYNRPGTIRSANGNKLTIPGHVRAALNYNKMLDTFDKGAKRIRGGDKVLVYYLSKNDFGFDSIAVPAELTRFPDWFSEHFKVDIKKTEDRMFDSKLSGIFSALGKDVPTPQSVLTNSLLEF